MAKKGINNSYFNLFNAEDTFEKEIEHDTLPSTAEEAYPPSFIEMTSSEKVDEDEHTPQQTTMFDDLDLLNEESEDEEATFIEEVVVPVIEEVTEIEPVEEIKEDTAPSIIEEVIVPVKESSNYFAKEDNVEEDKIISMLETNPLDEESVPQQIEFNQEEEESIFNNILTYNEIKKLPEQESFEMPYLYQGKTSDKIRYRLQENSKKAAKANRVKKSMISWIITIVSAILIAILLRSYVFVIATVDGPSMLPTLENKEKLFVTKYTYKISDFKRGDIVICRYGTEAYPLIYVKRIIGLGGEVVSVVDGKVLINGAVLEEDYILDAPVLDMDPVYVPEGYVFVMGDNRNNSADSRKPTIGPLKEELIIGKVRFRVSPIKKFGSLEG